jgi:hypothetical protein
MHDQAKRIQPWRPCLAVLGLSVLLTANVGCDSASGPARRAWLGHSARSNPGIPTSSGSTYDIDAMRDGTKLELPDDNPSSVFSKGGKTGAWSSEARDIEKSLGVGP